MSAHIKDKFTDEVIAEFRTELKKVKKATKRGMFNKRVIDAYEDILDCIEKESIKDIEELDTYVDENYSKIDSEYMVIAFIVQYAEDDFDGGVSEIFRQGKQIDLSSILFDEDEEEFDEEFEGTY